MNPWWWSESSDNIIKGIDTLQYGIHNSTDSGSDADISARIAAASQDFIKENNLVVKSMGR